MILKISNIFLLCRYFHLGEVFSENSKWHHICITWKSLGGLWKVFVDGALRRIGKNFRAWHSIPGQGKFLLGRNYRDSESDIDQTDAFQGMLGQVNLWSTVKNADFVKTLVRSCLTSSSGTLVDWRSFRHNLRGEVRVIEPQSCETPGNLNE